MAAGPASFEPIETPLWAHRPFHLLRLAFSGGGALRGNTWVPAANQSRRLGWVGRSKAEQWRTLLSARAIENEIFVAGLKSR